MSFRETVRQLAEQSKLDSLLDSRRNHNAENAESYRQNSAQEIARLRALFASRIGDSTRFAYQDRAGYGTIVSVSSTSVTLATPGITRRFRSFTLAYVYNVVK